MEKGSWVGVQIILPGAVAALPVQIGFIRSLWSTPTGRKSRR